MAAVGDQLQQADSGIDDASRGHLRNIEMYSGRMIDEMTSGRDQMLAEIKSEIKLLARTIAATAEQPKDAG